MGRVQVKDGVCEGVGAGCNQDNSRNVWVQGRMLMRDASVLDVDFDLTPNISQKTRIESRLNSQRIGKMYIRESFNKQDRKAATFG